MKNYKVKQKLEVVLNMLRYVYISKPSVKEFGEYLKSKKELNNVYRVVMRRNQLIKNEKGKVIWLQGKPNIKTAEILINKVKLQQAAYNDRAAEKRKEKEEEVVIPRTVRTSTSSEFDKLGERLAKTNDTLFIFGEKQTSLTKIVNDVFNKAEEYQPIVNKWHLLSELGFVGRMRWLFTGKIK